MRTNNNIMNFMAILLVSFVATSKAATHTLSPSTAATHTMSPRKGGKCKDKKGKFWILDGHNAGTQRDCKWAKEKKWRCNSIPEAVEHCPKTCDHCGKENPTTTPSTIPSFPPSPAPVEAPSSAPVKAPSCKDVSYKFNAPSIGWFKGKTNCYWAAKRKDARCQYEDIKDKCPVLCNTCCRDKEGRFEITIDDKTELKTCDWVARKDNWWRCKYPEAQEHCPNTCRVCETRTNEPSMTPVTLHPTSSSSPIVCSDEPGWMTVDEGGKFSGKTCTDIAENPKVWCPYLLPYANEGVTTFQACCVCGKTDASLAPSTTHSHSPSMQPSTTSSPSILASESPSTAPTQCIDEPEWIWDEKMNYGCAEMSKGFCDTFSSNWVNGKNSYMSCCVCGGGIHVPLAPSTFPSISMSPSISLAPSFIPSSGPSTAPTVEPTKSSQPSPSPTSSPSTNPSLSPSNEPSTVPTYLPSSVPSIAPTTIPTTVPSHFPSDVPSTHPSSTPTHLASSRPSAQPSACSNERDWIAKSTDPILSSMDSNCEAIEASKDPDLWCSIFDVEYNGKSTYEACCICGGGNHHPSNVVPIICVDEPNWKWKEGRNGNKYCEDFPSHYCDSYDNFYFNGKNAKAACCACGGGSHMSKNEP